jgi:hypothetical protein
MGASDTPFLGELTEEALALEVDVFGGYGRQKSTGSTIFSAISGFWAYGAPTP